MSDEEHEERWCETERFVFRYYSDEESQEIRNALKMRVTLLEDKDMTKDDLGELRSFLKNMGKWENFSDTARNLLEDVGMISSRSTYEQERRFGYEKYNVVAELDNGGASLTIRLSPEERRRRIARAGDTPARAHAAREWNIGEITTQIKNIQKWQMLRRTFSDFGKQL